jgi:argininosuccinate lyase
MIHHLNTVFSTNEVYAIRVDEGFVQTSSIFAAKRNPPSIETYPIQISRTIGEWQSAFIMAYSVLYGDIGDEIQPMVKHVFSQSVQFVELLMEILRDNEDKFRAYKDKFRK